MNKNSEYLEIDESRIEMIMIWGYIMIEYVKNNLNNIS